MPRLSPLQMKVDTCILFCIFNFKVFFFLYTLLKVSECMSIYVS